MRLIRATLGILIAAAPLSLVSTLLMIPAWRWLESAHSIESIGHSGPAAWCYVASYLVWAALLAGIAMGIRARSVASRNAQA